MKPNPAKTKPSKLEKLLRRPRHLRELMSLTGGSERSVYRWIEQLTKAGHRVVREPGRAPIFRII